MAACFGLSSVNRRTTTLVSTAITAPNHFPSDSGSHLSRCLRFACGPQTAGDLVESRFGETPGGAQQNSIFCFFDRKLSARSPGPGGAYRFGQNDLALARNPVVSVGKTPVRLSDKYRRIGFRIRAYAEHVLASPTRSWLLLFTTPGEPP
jgi:hypothetical protein